MTTAQVLRKAKGLIRKHGWVQRVFGNSETGYCVMGAIRRASPALGVGGRDAFANALPSHMRGIVGPTAWNDAPRRTKAEVLRAFDKAIALAEKPKRKAKRGRK